MFSHANSRLVGNDDSDPALPGPITRRVRPDKQGPDVAGLALPPPTGALWADLADTWHVCYSRFMVARMIPTRHTEDLLLASWELIQQFGRAPRRLIWDNEPGIGRGQRRAEGVASFRGTLATRNVAHMQTGTARADRPEMNFRRPVVASCEWRPTWRW